MEGENASKSIKTNLPEEIIEVILLRLPVKSLLKFRCVSKSWRSLIDSDRFIEIHLENSTKNTSFYHQRMIFSLFQDPQRLLMHCSWRSLLNERAVDSFAFKNLFNIQENSFAKLVGCCNGLVCFLLNKKHFFLWNPSTRMCKKLPAVDRLLYGKTITKYGFGYDEWNKDYKVLVIITCYMSTRNPFIIRIFSLKTNSWKTLNYEDDPSQGFHGAGKFVSGNLHWSCRAVGCRDWEIVSFDLDVELFEIVETPSYAEAPSYQSLGVIEGCLSVFSLCRDSHSDIWVMKEYGVKESWVKVATLPHVQRVSMVHISSFLF